MHSPSRGVEPRSRISVVGLGLIITFLASSLSPPAVVGGPIAAVEGVSRSELSHLDFLLGEWSIVVRTPDRRRVIGKARTEVRRILEGNALQSDYEGFDPSGAPTSLGGSSVGFLRKIIFRLALSDDSYDNERRLRLRLQVSGTTVRTLVPSTGQLAAHWTAAEKADYTYWTEEYRNGELHGEGHGVDESGPFLERRRYFGIDDSHYSVSVSRSYDDGTTWQPWFAARATRTASAARGARE